MVSKTAEGWVLSHALSCFRLALLEYHLLELQEAQGLAGQLAEVSQPVYQSLRLLQG